MLRGYTITVCFTPAGNIEKDIMRIAISGMHAIGKSTLAEDFVENHPEFVLEAEPYYVLQEQFGIDFAEEPTRESFMTQLE